MSGLLLVVVHSGEKLLAMDDDGYSDPYCIVAANKEKVCHVLFVNTRHHLFFESQPVKQTEVVCVLSSPWIQRRAWSFDGFLGWGKWWKAF